MAPTHEVGQFIASIPEGLQIKREHLGARNLPSTQHYQPGGGVLSPFTINNDAVFALFGLLGAGLVLTSIWFFFWAKNGGFRFRKGDWDEYKSTVLRRKGPNGTTLSGATKTTDLGGGSIVGSQGSFSEFDDPEKAAVAQNAVREGKKKEAKNRHDKDVRAYRHEKAARVGGLNRAADGSYNNHTVSDISSQGGPQPLPRGGRETIKPVRASNPLHRQFSFSAGTEATFSTTTDDSRRPLNHTRQHDRHHPSAPNSGTRHHARQPSSPKRTSDNPHRSRQPINHGMPGSFADPLDLDSRYEASDVGSDQIRHTKAYFHPIPGLASTGAGPSRGYRRGVGGGRDGLSDSEGEF